MVAEYDTFTSVTMSWHARGMNDLTTARWRH